LPFDNRHLKDEFAMSSDNLVQTLQTGFRITVGATASLLESLQDDRKREENLETLKLDWMQIADKWAEKGQQTEREARDFVDGMLSQGQSAPSRPPTDPGSSSAPETSATAADAAVQTELQTLTEQIATLRKELEQLREREDS
jgi:polyhydroxyalkanoate synthesis regulator phasin